jgi:hypothetical protein
LIDVTAKECDMTQPIAQPKKTKNGIIFTVRVDSINRDCVISKEALAKLSKFRNGVLDLMEIFRAFETTIYGVARRMVAANVPGTPLPLGPKNFY